MWYQLQQYKLINLIRTQMKWFERLKAAIRLREAVKKADLAHRETGERYYVMPISGTNKHLVVMDKHNFKKLKRKGYIDKVATVRDLASECFYCTPYRNGMGQLSKEIDDVKREEYYSWCKK